MVAIDFGDNSGSTSRLVVKKLKESGILVLTAGINEQYIRLLPPLNINNNDLFYFINKFKKIINSIE